jgi:hypothetical protein
VVNIASGLRFSGGLMVNWRLILHVVGMWEMGMLLLGSPFIVVRLMKWWVRDAPTWFVLSPVILLIAVILTLVLGSLLSLFGVI